ncbi:hypothetical protein CUMW_016330 [Citrus unshiu]|nr:hypothetical protein CUMW_016330 [Citrus unshiu]
MSVSTSTTEGNQASSGDDKYPIPLTSYINTISSSSSTSSRSGSTSSIMSEIEEEEEEEEENYNSSRSNSSQLLSEINDGNGMPMPLAPIKEEIESSFFSFDVANGNGTQEEDIIYVAVGKSQCSMDALSWTLRHAVNPSTLIFLIHVFPQVKFVPSPLGKLPRNQVNPEQLETFMAQETGKRRQLLQKFLDTCSQSKVMVDTVLIESDLVAKAILDLIPVLNIRKLVVGTTKSSLRKSKSGRISGMADHILQSAPETCEIKVVCEGKEVIDQMINDSPSPRNNDHNSLKASQEKNELPGSFSCMCFKL